MINVKKGQPLYEQIYENLKGAIVSGELQPGERIVDAWVAEQLKVSRSPVREALRKLEQDGLIKNQDGVTLVYKPTAQDVIELFQVRAGLEGMAVLLSTNAMSEQEIEEVGKTVSQAEKAVRENKFDEVIRSNTYFHEAIITFSRNETLHEMMKKINTLTFLYRNQYFTKYYGNNDFLAEHFEIYQAMKARNAELASERMRNHILNDLTCLIEKINLHTEI